MKHFQSIIKTVAICAISVIFCNCDDGPGPPGDYRFTDEARGFLITDTIAKSFKMIDNYGITDEFENSAIGNYDGKFYRIYKEDDGGSYESFTFHTYSVLNSYSFYYDLTSFTNVPRLWIAIYSKDGFISELAYEFPSKRIINSNKPKPEVKFYDSMEVRGVTHDKIMEIDFSKISQNENKSYIVKMYYSGSTGLIKFIRKDGNYFERI